MSHRNKNFAPEQNDEEDERNDEIKNTTDTSSMRYRVVPHRSCARVCG